MRKILFASHAYLAKGMLSSLELIMGEQKEVDVLCAYTENDYDIKKEIQKHLEKLADGDELIVVTDVFGGSVNNEFVSVIENTEQNIYLVSGLNLSLVMNLVLRKDEEEKTETIIRECIKESQESVRFCNCLLSDGQSTEDEEF